MNRDALTVLREDVGRNQYVMTLSEMAWVIGRLLDALLAPEDAGAGAYIGGVDEAVPEADRLGCAADKEHAVAEALGRERDALRAERAQLRAEAGHAEAGVLVGQVRIARTGNWWRDAEGVRHECRALEAEMLRELETPAPPGVRVWDNVYPEGATCKVERDDD